MKNKKLKFWIFLFVVITSSWTFSILKAGVFYFLFLFSASFFLVFTPDLKLKKFRSLFLFLVTVLFLASLIFNFDKNRYSSTDYESLKVMERKEYYAKEFGWFYRNRVGTFIFYDFQKYLREYFDNLYSFLDLTVYFNPVYNKTRFLFFLLPFFIYGFIKILLTLDLGSAVFASFMIFLMGLVDTNSLRGLDFIYPLFILFLTEGVFSFLLIFYKFSR